MTLCVVSVIFVNIFYHVIYCAFVGLMFRWMWSIFLLKHLTFDVFNLLMQHLIGCLRLRKSNYILKFLLIMIDIMFTHLDNQKLMKRHGIFLKSKTADDAVEVS